MIKRFLRISNNFWAVPYIVEEGNQPAVDGPGPVAKASPGHRSLEVLLENAFVEEMLVTKEEACGALSSVL